MPRPPFVLSPVFSRRAFLALLSWRLYLAGEYELQNRYGERDHSHADGRPCGNDGGRGSFVPVVGF